MRRLPLLLAFTAGMALTSLSAQRTTPPRADRSIYLDTLGVMRWQDDSTEIALFGSNYVIHGASDYRAAGAVGGDRKRMIDEDVAHFARMGWGGMRLTFWGDWEASDSAGNLIANDHLDLLDYLIAKARERGIYLLFSPIQLYGSNWPDALADTSAPGFGRHFGKGKMGTDPGAIAAQVTYLKQILDHVNPYTGVAIKDEPAILFIELVNEPLHHPEDMAGSVRYINTLTDAVRSTGFNKLVFYNVSQDFRIAPAIRQSKAQGVAFGWYPTGLNSGHELLGNHLRSTDVFPDMRQPVMKGMPRIVYEFDSADLRDGTMYPAMVRTFRAVGTQFAAMFAYDMLATASRNLGWQTHYLNMVYTPKKAVSSIIAAEAMRRLPRLPDGQYPENTRFGDFRLSPADGQSELVAKDAFMYAGSTTSTPPDVTALRRIVGYGSSSTVRYEGEGIYFLDWLAPGVWRLEVYPDAVPVLDPFEPPRVDKIVTRAISRAWPMIIGLTELGRRFTVQPIASGNAFTTQAAAGRFVVTPGVYLLSANGPVELATLSAFVGAVGLREYHGPRHEPQPATVVSLSPPTVVSGGVVTLRARVVDSIAPDSVTLFVRPVSGGAYRGHAMVTTQGYEYAATIPAGAALRAGPHEFVITSYRGTSATTFPSGIARRPTSWDYNGTTAWPLDVIDPGTPLTLFAPGVDASRLAFTRIGDGGRTGLFSVPFSSVTGAPVIHLELPSADALTHADYTASLMVSERVAPRRAEMSGVAALRLRVRGLARQQPLHLTLMESNGTSWSAVVRADSGWSEELVPLSAFTVGRGVMLPQGFPGQWNYWVGAATGRGGRGDRPRLEQLERLLFSLRPDGRRAATTARPGVEVEWVRLEFRRAAPSSSPSVPAAASPRRTPAVPSPTRD